jgi:hypothetical protein
VSSILICKKFIKQQGLVLELQPRSRESCNYKEFSILSRNRVYIEGIKGVRAH